MSQLGPKDLAELMGLMAHDLRNPLSALFTNINFLRASLHDSPAEVLEAVSDSTLCCAMLGQFIANLDVLGRSLVDSPPPSSAVILQKAADEAVTRFASQSKALGVDISMSTGEAAPSVLADPRWLGRALDNVLANSLQYAPAHSTVNVSLEIRAQRGVVLVVDDGPVIPPDLRAWALSIGAQAHAKKRFEARYGRGLGLYCAAESARLAGAEISIGERQGRAAFEMSAPLFV
ncbi:MAG TPA: HAMP domain-containing sensor histidine kinase [Polyangiaceae bacterium]